jgi:hydrogenase expression/formation protein HypD
VFGTACTPEKPLGALMVSSEGACAAYHQYGRIDVKDRRATMDVPVSESLAAPTSPPA